MRLICDWCVIRGRIVCECMKCGGAGSIAVRVSAGEAEDSE